MKQKRFTKIALATLLLSGNVLPLFMAMQPVYAEGLEAEMEFETLRKKGIETRQQLAEKFAALDPMVILSFSLPSQVPTRFWETNKAAENSLTDISEETLRSCEDRSILTRYLDRFNGVLEQFNQLEKTMESERLAQKRKEIVYMETIISALFGELEQLFASTKKAIPFAKKLFYQKLSSEFQHLVNEPIDEENRLETLEQVSQKLKTIKERFLELKRELSQPPARPEVRVVPKPAEKWTNQQFIQYVDGEGENIFSRLQQLGIFDENHLLTVGKQLGKGAFGAVYELPSAPNYVVKICQAGPKDDYSKLEELTGGKISSLHFVVKPFARLITNKGMVINVMKKRDGGSLEDKIESSRSVAYFQHQNQVINTMASLLCSLARIHEQGISHNDVFIKNILLKDVEKGRLLLADLGIASRIRENIAVETKALPGRALSSTTKFRDQALLHGQLNDVNCVGYVILNCFAFDESTSGKRNPIILLQTKEVIEQRIRAIFEKNRTIFQNSETATCFFELVKEMLFTTASEGNVLTVYECKDQLARLIQEDATLEVLPKLAKELTRHSNPELQAILNHRSRTTYGKNSPNNQEIWEDVTPFFN